MNKYLEKVAAAFGTRTYKDFDKIYDTFKRRVPDHSNKISAVSALGAGTVGAGLGYAQKEDYMGNKYTHEQRLAHAAAVGGLWGAAGGVWGKLIPTLKRDDRIFARAKSVNEKAFDNRSKAGFKNYKGYENFDDFFKEHFRQGGGAYRSSSRTVDDILRDMDAPAGGFKTKAEASKHFKRMAMKHHPDRGGDTEKMKKINAAFDEFKAHPDGFEKLAGLANIYLEKVAEYL